MKLILERVFQVVLWLKVALSPTLFAALLGLAFCIVREDITPEPIIIAASIGFAIGAIWAEYIRRTRGLLEFHSRLLGRPNHNETYGA